MTDESHYFQCLVLAEASIAAREYDRRMLYSCSPNLLVTDDTVSKPKPKPTHWQRFVEKLKTIIADLVQSIHDQAVKTGAYCSCDCEY